jgi:hypothetical protein
MDRLHQMLSHGRPIAPERYGIRLIPIFGAIVIGKGIAEIKNPGGAFKKRWARKEKEGVVAHRSTRVGEVSDSLIIRQKPRQFNPVHIGGWGKLGGLQPPSIHPLK